MEDSVDMLNEHTPGQSRRSANADWDAISPASLRRNALFSESRGTYGSYDDPVNRRDAAFPIALGLFLGLALILVLYRPLAGSLGPFVALPPVVLGAPLVFARNNLARNVGFGLLVSVPAAALLGVGLFFLATL